jgi:hypothetical protein
MESDGLEVTADAEEAEAVFLCGGRYDLIPEVRSRHPCGVRGGEREFVDRLRARL